MLSSPDMAPKVSQGVTTVVAGNCGISLAPAPKGMRAPVAVPLDLLDDEGGWFRYKTFKEYVDALRSQPAATNCALLVGHSMLRVQTMDSTSRRRPRGNQEPRDGGRSDGGGCAGAFDRPLLRAGECRADRRGDRALPAARGRNGIYCTHMRNEGEHILDSLEETFRVGREANVPVVISHHKVAGKPNHGRSAETLPVIAKAMREQRVALDCYLPRVFDHPFGEPRGECDEGARHVVEAASRGCGHGPRGDQEQAEPLGRGPAAGGQSTSRWTRRMCSAFWRSSPR